MGLHPRLRSCRADNPAGHRELKPLHISKKCRGFFTFSGDLLRFSSGSVPYYFIPIQPKNQTSEEKNCQGRIPQNPGATPAGDRDFILDDSFLSGIIALAGGA
jgi:hypothetical protein